MKTYLRLLFLSLSIGLVGLSGCSATTAGTGRGVHAALIQKTDSWQDDDSDPVAANRDWYQMID
jgi:hypothetical protein